MFNIDLLQRLNIYSPSILVCNYFFSMFYNNYIDNEIYFNDLVNINNKKYYSVVITNIIL